MNDVTFIIRNLENQESVREKSGKSQGIVFVKVCGNPELYCKVMDCNWYIIML